MDDLEQIKESPGEFNDQRVTQIEDFLEKLYYFLPPIAELNEFKVLKEVENIK